MALVSQEITVGVPWCRLHAHAPRGVVRVARNVVERLALERGIRLLAISDPVFERGEIIFECQEMKDWLAEHPLTIPTPPNVHVHFSAAPVPHAASSPGPPAVPVGMTRKAWRRVLKPTLRATLQAVGLKRTASRVYRKMRGIPSPPDPLASVVNPSVALSSPPVTTTSAPPPPELLPWISARDVHVILSFECFDPIWEWPLEMFGCRLIGICHDLIPFRVHEGQQWNPGRYFRVLAQMVGRAHRIGCDSEATRADLERVYPASRNKTWLFTLAADAERFVHSSIKAEQRHPLVSKPGRKMAMVGDLEPRKNQGNVLRACRYLRAATPAERLTLILIGSRPLHDPHGGLAREAARWVDIEYAGYVPDTQIGDLLNSCDVFLYPSLWEGFGIPVLEAMHAAVPVVCAETASLPEVAGPHADYCDPHDPESIAATVRKVLARTPEERQRRVEAAKTWAAGFNWVRSAELCMREIQNIAAQPGTISHTPGTH